MIADPLAFIRAETRLLPVPHAPEILLHVADEATELWQKTEEELGEIGLAPPFWAFAWAGGQALARYILDHPETVRGKRVLDFASGSGLVAIAAIMLNAETNGVAVAPVQADLVGQDGGWDAVLAGDICYERDLAARVTEWLMSLSQRGATVLIGDPGRSYLPRESLENLAQYQVPVTRTLEDADIKKTGVWRFRHA